MTIGVFDSGVGGLTIQRALAEAFPEEDFVYLADQAHVPYGVRRGPEIVDLTRRACIRLFDENVDLIILGCNTASAVALRQLQQTWLPDYRRLLGRPVNILGIIVPTIEAATGVPWGGKAAASPTATEAPSLAIFATPATIASDVYQVEIAKTEADVRVFCEPCPDLAGLIERGAGTGDLTTAVAHHIRAVTARIGKPPDRAILGCTHYDVIAPLFRSLLPATTRLVHQPGATAAALATYLRRHPEYRPRVGAGSRRYLTTGRPGLQHDLIKTFWGSRLHFEAA